uniref:RNA-directed DNA polymerase, eukaryota, reverse transcriptase zinc-binding domain protein n=1 Tax=Tanacetum cinerariifolium TaxID=118510 RepID=A0A699H9L7_TANCI|nr:RNA-directed DNA polymerase, eukaryota, reverse transcriptase zinc-binding domain protein [Tanacetum cinerariifolium]
MLGDGRDILFWLDRWVDHRSLCDKFPRLYHLDRSREGSVLDKGSSVNGVWDKWRWMLDDDGEFTVKELAKFIEEKIPHTDNGGQETVWNKLVPKKVNIFVWRALKGRLLVHVELDRRDIDLDSVLCLSCNIVVETCDHCLVTCDLAMSVWEKVFNWWKVGSIIAFSIDELFSCSGGVNVLTLLSHVWQAVIWTFGYLIWKEEIHVCSVKKCQVLVKLCKIYNSRALNGL